MNEKELKNKLPKGFKFNNEFDQFLFHPIDVKKSIGSIDDIFSVFRKKIEKNIKVRECIPTPKKLDNSNLLKIKFDIPKMSSLGYDDIIVHPNSAFPFLGGTFTPSSGKPVSPPSSTSFKYAITVIIL